MGNDVKTLNNHDHCPDVATKSEAMLARKEGRKGLRKITKSLIR